ncbi:transcription-repair coupling factor, partial [Streptococcus agalactiae]|nr:transcription-repair coupling factor [Streptococcus agalactiae]
MELFSQNKVVRTWHSGLVTNSRQLVMGFSGASKAIAIASAYEKLSKKIMVVTATQTDSDKLSSDISSLIGEDNVYQFFADDVPAAEFIFSSLDKSISRLSALRFLKDPEKNGVLITSISGLRLLLPNPEVFSKSQYKFEIGQECYLDKLCKNLVNLGYQKVSQVFSPGEFSQRGDILDIFEMTQEYPYRLEFFGDEIDGIRQFDIDTQKSLKQLESVQISPADDIILQDADFERAKKKLEGYLVTASEVQRTYLSEVLSTTENHFKHSDIRRFLSIFYEKEWGILDYIPEGTPLFVDDFQKIVDRNAKLDLEIASLLTEDLQQGKSHSSLNYFSDPYKQLRQYQPATFFSNFHKGLGNLKFDKLHHFTQYGMQEFFNQFPLLVDEINRYKKSGATVLLQVDSQKGLNLLQENLKEYGLD